MFGSNLETRILDAPFVWSKHLSIQAKSARLALNYVHRTLFLLLSKKLFRPLLYACPSAIIFLTKRVLPF